MAIYALNQLHSVPLAELQSDPAQPRKYLDQQAKIAARQTGAATPRKRTKAETLTSQIGAIQDKIGDLELLSFAPQDREMVMAAMTALQNAMNDAFNRAAQ